jgi:Leucine-rich repeat (LRR) protein
MRLETLVLLCLVLALKLTYVVTEEEEEEEDDDRSSRILFKFSYEGEQSICDYRHPSYGYSKIPVPNFMRALPAQRIAEELQTYLQAGQKWSQRMILEMLYYALTYGKDYKPTDDPEYAEYPCLQGRKGWLDAKTDVCQWEGITCGNIHPSKKDRPRVELKLYGKIAGDYEWPPWEEFRWPSRNIITKIDLAEMKCKGTLPEDLNMLPELRRLNLRDNAIHGTIPSTYGDWLKMDFLDLSNNQLTGVPWQLTKMSKTLQELWLGHNKFEGAVHFYLSKMSNLQALDLSNNQISGAIPKEVKNLQMLKALFMENNRISGKFASELCDIPAVEFMHLHNNQLTGTIPNDIVLLASLRQLYLQNNQINGTLPGQITGMHGMMELKLASNQLTGTIPVGDDMGGEEGFRWSRMYALELLDFSNNNLTGRLSPAFMMGIASRIETLDFGFNSLTGTIPPEFSRMNRLRYFEAPFNKLEGTIPFEVGRLYGMVKLNVTSNKLVGTIPEGLCDQDRDGHFHIMFFGCDAILCPGGTFHPNGAADNLGACRECPKSKMDDLFDPPFSKILGRTTCDGATFLVGDKNADGMQSPREILHFLYMQNQGVNWGDKFRAWLDVTVEDCDLPGITCVGVDIAKIDLSDALMCADGKGLEAAPEDCHGIPAELRLLSNLEVISMPRRHFLRGTIPSELGTLPKLRYLDISNCAQMTGTIPTELGRLLNLKVLILSQSQFNGTIPSELLKLPLLEKLHLSGNRLNGTIPRLGEAKKLKELMLSRLMLTGTIPRSMGKLANIENIELYGSNIRGRIPSEIGRCSSLKRLDAFNNRLTGTIPTTLAEIKSLQIIHLKKNQLTGRLPEEFGDLSILSWIDISNNILSGTIPSSYGDIRTLKDLRLGGNRIHSPIPSSLCNNHRVNGGRTRNFGCDAILCPLGQYDATGFAFDAEEGCHSCEKGTTIYLGSTECADLHVDDLLSMFYDVMGGELWDETEVFRWKSDINICHWNGIICEDDGTLVSLSFPLTQATDPLGDPIGVDPNLYYLE